MDLGNELEKAHKEIFRFEALQEYFSDGSDEVENEINRQWAETGRIDMDLMKEWHDFITKKVKNGVKFIWVRLVEFPLNAYTKCELYIFKRRIIYGIDIRIIIKKKLDTLGLPVQDFYLLDKKNLLLMNYGVLNEYLGCEINNKNFSEYTKYKDLLVKHSVPISEFSY